MQRFLLIKRPPDGYVKLVSIDEAHEAVKASVGVKYDNANDVRLVPDGTEKELFAYWGTKDRKKFKRWLAQLATVIYVFGDNVSEDFSALMCVTRGSAEEDFFEPLIDAVLNQGNHEHNAWQFPR